jgi:hypothetical protein
LESFLVGGPQRAHGGADLLAGGVSGTGERIGSRRLVGEASPQMKAAAPGAELIGDAVARNAEQPEAVGWRRWDRVHATPRHGEYLGDHIVGLICGHAAQHIAGYCLVVSGVKGLESQFPDFAPADHVILGSINVTHLHGRHPRKTVRKHARSLQAARVPRQLPRISRPPDNPDRPPSPKTTKHKRAGQSDFAIMPDW